MKKLPNRTCVGCNTIRPKKDLIRIVKDKEGQVSVDQTGRANGRGAYLCNDVSCLEKAIKTKRLDKALETRITEQIYEDIRGVMIGQ